MSPAAALNKAIIDAISSCRLMEVEADRIVPPRLGETQAERCARICRYAGKVWPTHYFGVYQAVPLATMLERTDGRNSLEG